jgi:radical SAM protein with 4Fe4S-binding SPASM domain
MGVKQIYFVITRRCNLFCSHCIRSSGPGLTDHLQLEDVERVLKKLSVFKSAQLLISGGEPSLHPEFLEICNIASHYFDKVNINTNGLRPEILLIALSQTKGKISFQISIDGNEFLHNKIRGHGTYRRTLDAIKSIGGKGRVIVSSTIGDENIDSLTELDEDLKDLPFFFWSIQREVVYGRAALASKRLNTENWNTFVKNKISNFRNFHRIRAKSMFDWNNLYAMKQNKLQSSEFYNCGTGHAKFYINPDLSIFPCGCMEDHLVANAKNDSPDDILHAIQSLDLSPKGDSVCSKCPFVDICRGGCPGSSYNYFGEFGHGDPRCPAVRDLRND